MKPANRTELRIQVAIEGAKLKEMNFTELWTYSN